MNCRIENEVCRRTAVQTAAFEDKCSKTAHFRVVFYDDILKVHNCRYYCSRKHIENDYLFALYVNCAGQKYQIIELSSTKTC